MPDNLEYLLLVCLFLTGSDDHQHRHEQTQECIAVIETELPQYAEHANDLCED